MVALSERSFSRSDGDLRVASVDEEGVYFCAEFLLASSIELQSGDKGNSC